MNYASLPHSVTLVWLEVKQQTDGSRMNRMQFLNCKLLSQFASYYLF